MIQVKINGIDYTQYAVQPFKWNNLLDERLDEAVITLRAVPQKSISPLSVVEVVSQLGNSTKTEYYVTGDYDPTEVPSGSGLYDYELPLLETTKLLERVTCDTLVFLNNLGRTYVGEPKYAVPIWDDN